MYIIYVYIIYNTGTYLYRTLPTFNAWSAFWQLLWWPEAQPAASYCFDVRPRGPQPHRRHRRLGPNRLLEAAEEEALAIEPLRPHTP